MSEIFEDKVDQKVPQMYNLSALRRHYTNPHPLYKALRAQDSLYFDKTNQCWLATGHASVMAILRDERFTSQLDLVLPSDDTATHGLHRLVSKQFIFLDGEPHARAQQVTVKALARMVKRMPEQIRTLLQEIVVRMSMQREVDLVRDFASPVSLLIIAHLLGIPTHNYDHLLQLEQWSDTFGDITSGYFRGEKAHVEQLEDYFRQLIANKRRTPAEDLLSTFIAEKDIFSDEDDLIANCLMFFSAGRVTTKKLLGNGLPALLPQWEQLQTAIRQQSSLPKLLGEELFRFITPTRYLIRRAREDIDLSNQFPGEHRIRQGEKVFLFLEAANYDPQCFPQPESYNPYRHPNKHLAFGYGVHQCPGATLARMEVKLVLEILLSTLNISARPGAQPTWNRNPNLGGFVTYPAVVEQKLPYDPFS